MRTARYYAAALVVGLLLPSTLASPPAAQPAAPTTAPAKSDPASQPAPAPPPTAREVVESAMREVLTILPDANLSPAEKRGQVRDVAYAHMDFETISRLSMGRNWRDVPEPKRAEFIEEFRIHMSATYGSAIDRYTDEDITVTGDRREVNGDRTIPTVIGKPGADRQNSIGIDYRLRRKGEQWMVIDVSVDGVSMVANFRSQFQSILAQGGIDRLLALLREKNATTRESLK